MRLHYLPYEDEVSQPQAHPINTALIHRWHNEDTMRLKRNPAIVPYLEHVPITGDQAHHDTGVIVHVVAKDKLYHSLSKEEFRIAKNACRYLIRLQQYDLENAQDKMSIDSSSQSNKTNLALRVHEYNAARHHYQLNFKGRS